MRVRLVNRVLTDLCRRFCSLPLSGPPNSFSNAQSVIYKSPHPDIVIPKITVTELVTRDFKKFGKKEALIEAVTGRTLTFDQFNDAIWKVASGMSRQGFGKGDVLLVVSENSIDFVVIFHAALSLGGVVSTCNNHYLVEDIVRQANHSSASYIYCSHLSAVKIKEVLPKVKTVKKVFTSGHEEGFVPMAHLMEDDGQCFPSSPVADSMSTALLPYSSGTTGLPKGVMISHYGEVANCLQIDLNNYLPENGRDCQLAILPFYHIFGIIVHLLSVPSRGLPTVIMSGFDPVLFLECIQKYKVGMTHLVPPVLTFLAKHDLVSKFDLNSLCRIVSGAAPLGKETIQKFNERFPQCVVSQGYGMTESGPVVAMNQIETSISKPGSCGRLVPNTFLKVIGDNHLELPPGKIGEFLVKGPQMMQGYLNNPKATSEMIDEDGWLRTGDIGFVDDDGFLHVVDRAKELIKYKGLQVPPAELENLLCSHAGVADAAVIGVSDEEAGEIPKAFVVLRQGFVLSEQELQEFINDRVVSYKRLRGGISFVPQIPRSPAGKILRNVLRNEIKAD